MDSFGDSLDLVPIAAFDGQGNRKGVYGSFLLACYDRQNDEFQSICKIGSGFSEEVLKKCCSSLQSKVISVPKPYFRYGNTLKPDAWFEPSEVWEVRAADLTISVLTVLQLAKYILQGEFHCNFLVLFVLE